ncbi:MAG: calcium-binding protein [Rhodobacterales bacterium]|nr:calcium-binding protein [Rhodobacterales bacterium]
MANIERVTTVAEAPSGAVNGITDLEVVWQDGEARLYSTTRAGGAVARWSTDGGLTLLDHAALASSSTLPAPGRLLPMTVAGESVLAVTGANAARVGGFRLNGSGDLAAAFDIGGSPGGVVTALETVSAGGKVWAFSALSGQGSLQVRRLQDDGTMTGTATVRVASDGGAGRIVALDAAQPGTTPFLLVLAEDALATWTVRSDGTLAATDRLGAEDGLGLADPAVLCQTVLDGVTYAMVAAVGSSSVSVLRVSDDGSLQLADHVIDTLDTRFAGAGALTTVTLGDRVFVLAAGGDQGLTLMVLLPGGRLVAVGQFLFPADMPAGAATALAAMPAGDRIEIWLATEGAGLTRLTAAVGEQAPMQQGGSGNDSLRGDARADLILGAAGNDTLIGDAGDDILVDGTGSDRLEGGAGADLYVLQADGGADTIAGFEPGVDRIDLSGWGPVYSLAALKITQTSTGMRIEWGEEVLVITSASGQPIDPARLTAADLLGLWHASTLSTPQGRSLAGGSTGDALTGGSGQDTLNGGPGPDALDGGSGIDTVDYTGGTGSHLIDLLYPELNTNTAAGDIYVSIENVVGTQGTDNIRGTTGDNRLQGMANVDYIFGRSGNDTLDGGVGDDVLFGGVGQDVLIGGDNRDRAQYSQSLEGLVLDLLDPGRNTGEAAGDSYSSIEDLAGSEYADQIFGDGLDNRLFGRAGADQLSGRSGNDYLNGGAGPDRLQGDAGNDTLRGGDAADEFVFHSGQDVVEEFSTAAGDTLWLEDALWGGGRSADHVVAVYAEITAAGVVFDFGSGRTVTLQGLTTTDGLAEALVFF